MKGADRLHELPSISVAVTTNDPRMYEKTLRTLTMLSSSTAVSQKHYDEDYGIRCRMLFGKSP
jgi:hypothetical protein